MIPGNHLKSFRRLPALFDEGVIRPEGLFVNHSLLETRNPRQARSSVEAVFFKHLLRTCLSSESVNFVHRGAKLGSLSFNLISYGAEVEVAVNDINRSHYVVVVPLSGKAAVKNHDQSADLEAGALVVLDPLSRFKFEMRGDHSHLAIGIPKARLADFFTHHCHQLGVGWIEFERKPYLVKDIGSSLFNFLGYICQEIDKPGTITTQNAVAASLEETFLSMLVSTLVAPTLPVGNTDQAWSEVPVYVEKAERFMEANLTENITAHEIAEASGVPMRTLYHAYHKYRGLSPMAWLKIRRLRQARFDLLDAAQTDVSVTEISLRYQQNHIGRFSRAYFQEFGEYPSETRKK